MAQCAAFAWVVMSGAGFHWLRSRLLSAVGPTAVTVGLLTLCSMSQAQTLDAADDTGPLLRGRVEESQITGKKGTKSGDPSQQTSDPTAQSSYEPISSADNSEPEPEPPAGASLFEDPSTARAEREIFGNPPVSAARPTTAAKRAEDRKNRLNAGPETAAERRKREAAERAKRRGSGVTTQDSRLRTGTVDSQIDRKIDPGAEPVGAIELKKRKEDENPFEAPGIRAGTFILRPSVEQGVTFTDNVNYSSTPAQAILSETTLRLNAISEFGGDSTALGGYGIFRKSVSGEEYEYGEGGLNADLVRRLADDYSVKGSLAYAMRPELFSSPVEVTGAATRPIQQTLNATAGVAKDVGKLRLGITAGVDREWYGDADVEGVGPVSQEDRNSTLATVTLRGGYEISPALRPFVEVQVGRRVYDLEQDVAGYERSANHYAANAGVELNLDEKLSGEVSAGYVQEELDDARLGSIGGLNLAGQLNWSPERGTIVGLSGSTEIEGTTDVASAGSLLYSGRLSIERNIRANLTANANLGLAYRDYQSTGDSDTIYSAEAGGTWWLNRYTGITGRARHETMKSTLPNRDTSTNSVFLGLRLQR